MMAAKEHGVAVHLWAVQAADGDYNQSEDLVAEADERRVLDRAWITKAVRAKELTGVCAPPPAPRPEIAAILSAPLPDSALGARTERPTEEGEHAPAAAPSENGTQERVPAPKGVPTPKDLAALRAPGVQPAQPPASATLRWSSDKGWVDRPGGAAESPDVASMPTLAQLTTAEQRWADREEDITTVGGDPYEVGQVFARRWMGTSCPGCIRGFRIGSTGSCCGTRPGSGCSRTRTIRSTSMIGTRSGPDSGGRSTCGPRRSTLPRGSDRCCGEFGTSPHGELSVCAEGPTRGRKRGADPVGSSLVSTRVGQALRHRGDVVCAVRGLTKTYPAVRGRRGAPGTPEVRATDDVRLDIRGGEIFGLLGPNGAGKTTLVRQLTGLMRPDAGSVEILGHDIVRHPERAARILAYLGQESTALDDLTVSLAAETTGRLRGLDVRRARDERDAVLDELGLGPLAGRPIRKLSGGQRRLACFAAALVGERPLLVLDEPTTAMDPVARRAVWSAVDRRRAERGTTVLLVTHNVIEAETVLDRVAVLDRGRVIACDTPSGLKERVAGEVRVELLWRERAPLDVPEVAALQDRAVESGRRWTLRLAPEEARAVVATVTGGAAFAALDDFTLATPSLEDVYLALGGDAQTGLVKA
jgi:ABC-2 type transport system ATP-binding protein